MPFQKRTQSEAHRVIDRPPPGVSKEEFEKAQEKLADLRKKAGVERPQK